MIITKHFGETVSLICSIYIYKNKNLIAITKLFNQVLEIDHEASWLLLNRMINITKRIDK